MKSSKDEIERVNCVCAVAGRLFTKAEVDEIMSVTVKKVILSVTDIPEDAIQDNPFFLNGSFVF